MRQRSYTGSRWGCEAVSFFAGRDHACYVRTTRAPLVSRSPHLTPTLLFPSSAPAAPTRCPRQALVRREPHHNQTPLCFSTPPSTRSLVSPSPLPLRRLRACRWMLTPTKDTTLPHDAACLRLRLRPRSTIFAAMTRHPLRSHCLIFLRMRNCACDSVLLLRLPQRAQQRCAPTCPRASIVFR